MEKHDLQAMKAAISLEDLIERHGVELKSAGPDELKGLCPIHGEKTPSFTVTVSKQQYYCFGCGVSGDHLSFIQDYHGCDFKAAIEILAGYVSGDFKLNPTSQKSHGSPKQNKGAVKKWITEPFVPEGTPPPKSISDKSSGEWSICPVVASWPYRDREGRLVGFACRVEFKKSDGSNGKNVIPMTWQTSTETGEQKLRQGSFPKPRTLYGADLLEQYPDHNVLIVEGEKATEAGRRIMSGKSLVVVSWPGGGKAAKHADWSQLQGRTVAMLPDCDSKTDKRTGEMLSYCDQPGMQAALEISKHVPGMKIVRVPKPGNILDGWDLADAEEEGWDCSRVLSFIKENLAKPEDIVPKETGSDLKATNGNNSEDQGSGSADLVEDFEDKPFRILGWDYGRAFYLPDGSSQVTDLSAAGHTKLNLLQLAPLSYWQSRFSNLEKKNSPVDWDMAANYLISSAQKSGIWDQDLIRGRGAWFDDGRVAIHAGDSVVIDGVQYPVKEAPTSYVYEAGRPFRLSMDSPLDSVDSENLVSICRSLRWEKEIYGTLLAGWVFLAPICGALEWRPHIWITGGAGSGKSTILTRILEPALSKIALNAVGETTEAGIRQQIKFDSVPVVFDEFESEREKASSRIQDILALATQSSSDSGAKIYKGGAGGKADSYRVRSMFAFASIAVNMKHQAIKSRMSVLSLKTPPEGYKQSEEDVNQFNELVASMMDTLTPDYVQSLHARAVKLIPVIRQNVAVFSKAAAVSIGTQRLGDQVGALLAGAYALFSESVVDEDKAKAWIESKDWSEVAESQDDRDEKSCLNLILAHSIRVDVAGGVRTRTIGELVDKLDKKHVDYEVQSGEAVDALARYGIRVEDGMMWLAQGHKEVERILSGTQYQESYSRVLLRIAGSERIANKRYAGVQCRGIAIPLN